MRHSLFIAFLFTFIFSYGQDEGESLLDLLGEEEEVTNYASASFKTTRIINSQSIENVAEGVLDFKISHRFGRVNGGLSEFFGLDQATIRLGLDYGITDRLMIGIGRSTVQKAIDGFAKYKLLRQSTGKKNMPVTLSLYSSIMVNAQPWANPERENYFSSRLFYTHQILLGRKFSNGTSLMLMPTVVHRNLVESTAIENTVYALGIGGRQKLTNRLALTFEYIYVLPDQIADIYTNSLSIGFDIETGGHVFQLHFTNSLGMMDKQYITETTGEWGAGDIHFGFNISRVFTLKDTRPKLKE
ncbi:MAG TPA: DUF5777 family beta-barrel protein [Cryomorphaceae bacterium]|nr:DUF5777 family beta-barrel protein [Cryomorphaceae bacterium]